MADIVTGTVTGQVDVSQLLMGQSDIRREQASDAAISQIENLKGFDRVNSDTLKSAWANTDATKDARHDVADRISATAAADSATQAAYFIAQQKNAMDAAAVAATTAATNEAGTLALQNAIAASGAQVAAANALAAATNAAAIQLDAAKTAAAVALSQAHLGFAVVTDGNATRALINTLKMDELNRLLTERNSAILESRGDSRLFGLSNQINALHSQFQAAAQGTVNFGTMGNNTPTSTNNVV